MLLDELVPRFEVSQRHALIVDAPPDRTFEAVRSFDLAGSPVSRLLLQIRGLLRPGHLGIDRLLDRGFVFLGEDVPRELVLGLVGRPWTPLGGIVRHLDADGFRAFDRPGYAKVGWNFTVEERGAGSRVRTETRIHCTDERSRRAFARYWRLIGPFSGVIRKEALRSIRDQAES
ncbi:MAG TPA: hypothetical protein VJ868_00405 [Actinomycetota bacterium]|jgi:hypothetical protein|nr:hypothetical protein [Actinomycetota bacterium]